MTILNPHEREKEENFEETHQIVENPESIMLDVHWTKPPKKKNLFQLQTNLEL
jgi:hypothetical protein